MKRNPVRFRCHECFSFVRNAVEYDVYAYPTGSVYPCFYCATFATLAAARSYIARHSALAVL